MIRTGYDPADDLDELTLLSEDELAELADQDDDEPLLLLPGYGRPATAAPRPLDPYRGLDTLPALDDYQPTPSEV